MGGDLTDPEDDGVDGAHTNWNWSSISASSEPKWTAEGSYNVFDNKVGSSNNKWCCNAPTQWIAVEFSQAYTLNSFTIASGNDVGNRDPDQWKIQGSNDGNNWTDIFTYSNDGTSPWSDRNQVLKYSGGGDDFATPDAYLHFRYHVTSVKSGSQHQINELEFFGTPDSTDPTLTSSVPADNATAVALDANIVLNFSESVDAESGDITIKKTSDDTTIETIDVTGGQVSGSGSSQITVDPSSDLDNGVEYYLLIDATAFDDTLGNSYAGISSKTALSFTTVSSNTNPFLNKQVVALTEAQTQAPKDLVQHITTPIFNRLYWLKEHQKGNNLMVQKLKVNFSNSTLNKLTNALQVSNEFNENSKNASDELSKWLFWSEGSVSVGRVGDTSLSSSKEIRSDGVTLGMDKLLNNDLTIGYAFRFNKDDVDVGETGTTLDTNAKSFSIYGNYPNDLNKYFETVIGFNLLNLESIRVDGSNKLTGSRNGRQVYGSIKYIGILGGENIYFSPNIKIDFSDTSLDEYSEIGTSALTFQKQNVQTTNIYSGFIVSNTIDFENFTIKPNGGLEIGLDISPSSEVKLNYVSDPNTVFVKSIEHKNEKLLNTNLGFDLTSNNGFSLMLLYKRNQNTNGHSDTLSLGVGYVPEDNVGYEANIKNGLANLKFNKKFEYFNVNLNSEYDIVSIDPNYGINFEITSEF